MIRRLAADVFPALGHLPITEITTPKLVAMAKKIEARGALDIAMMRGIPGMTIVDSCDALDLETATRCSSSRAAS